MLLNYKNEITILYNGADASPVFNSCFVHRIRHIFIKGYRISMSGHFPANKCLSPGHV